jgi:hypothetical protein
MEKETETASRGGSPSVTSNQKDLNSGLSKVKTGSENEKKAAEREADEEQRWMKGFSLFTMMTAVTIVIFLTLLDISIISTVWCYSITSSPIFFFLFFYFSFRL